MDVKNWGIDLLKLFVYLIMNTHVDTNRQNTFC